MSIDHCEAELMSLQIFLRDAINKKGRKFMVPVLDPQKLGKLNP